MAFDFYFAGTQCEEANQLMRELNANVLKSYVNDKKEILKWFEWKRQGWKGKLMIDNGEFTFHRKGGSLDIDEYIKWLNDNDEYIDYAIALDKIPGRWGHVKSQEEILKAPEQTWDNYCYMYDRVKSPKKLLPVFHQYDDFKWLIKILESGKPEYICLSGNKELTNAQREYWYDMCYSYIYKINPNIKVHCLGSATIQNAEKFPFTSMDATSWIMTGANGSILTDKGAIYIGNQILLSDIEKQYLNDIVKKYDLTVDDVVNDYKARMLVNVNYLFEKSAKTNFKNNTTTKRRLF